MDSTLAFVLIPLAAAAAALLTLFSGFGLGTLLLPVFALFFPVNIAIALTGVVHLLQNLFKLSLLGRHIEVGMALRFGLPSMLGAFLGARLLILLEGGKPLFTYTLGTRFCEITPVKLSVAALMVFFALMEIVPRLKEIRFSRRYLIPGGIVSGFFGGLSGHQGALRSAFLVRTGLGKEAFIATGVAIACMVDLTRLAVYARRFIDTQLQKQWPLLLAASLAAFAGAYLGARLLKKVTLQFVQTIVALMLLLIAVLLGAGVI